MFQPTATLEREVEKQNLEHIVQNPIVQRLPSRLQETAYEEPEDVLKLFKRGETLADYLGLQIERREKIRNILLERKGMNYGSDPSLMIRINHENKAYEAAQAYINWIKYGEAENLLKNNPGKCRQNLAGKIGLNNYLCNWNSEKRHPLGRNEKGKREWQPLYQNKCNKKPYKFYKLLDESTIEELEKAEKRAQEIATNYWSQEARIAATAYIIWIKYGEAENWLKNNPGKSRHSLEERIGLNNYLCNWNSEKRQPLRCNEKGKREWQSFYKKKCNTNPDNFYKLLDESTIEELEKAEERAQEIEDNYWSQEARIAATAYIIWIKYGEAENWLKNNPGKCRRNLDDKIGLNNYLDNWNSKKKQPLLKGKKGKREWQSFYKAKCNTRPYNFYELLDEQTAEDLKKAEEGARTIAADYWKQEARAAATAYINWINNREAENWLKNNPGKSRRNLDDRIGLKNYLCNWNSEKKQILERNNEGKREWLSLYDNKCNKRLYDFYKLLDDEKIARDLEKAEEKTHGLVRAYWRKECTTQIQKRFPFNIPHIAKPRDDAGRENIQYYLALFPYYVFEPGEKEHLIKELLKGVEASIENEDYKIRHEKLSQELKHEVLSRKNKRPWQLFAYLEHSNSLKMTVGDMEKYERLLKQIYPGYDEETNGLNVDTQELFAKSTSRNPNFKVEVITKPKGDKWGIEERVLSSFLKIYDSKERWKTECKVTEGLEQLDVPVIKPQAIILKDEIPNNEIIQKYLESISYTSETLTMPSLITSTDKQTYRYAIASEWVEGQTLRKTIENKWKELEDEAIENLKPTPEDKAAIDAKLKEKTKGMTSKERKDAWEEEALKNPDLQKKLAQQKYDSLLEELTTANEALHKLHNVKNVQGAKERDYNKHYSQLIIAREKEASPKLSETVYKIAEAYNKLEIGRDLNKYKENNKSIKSVIHGDLHLDNLFKTNTGKIKIIDTETAGIGLPQEDLAVILTEPYFNPEQEETPAEKTARKETEGKYLKHYLSNISETEHKSYMTATALCGLSRETAMIAHKMIDYEKAPEENKQHVKDSWNRHLRVFDKFANMAATYRPDMKEKIKDYAIEVKKLAA